MPRSFGETLTKLLLLLSEASLASEWVATEIRKARRAERKEGRQKLFPIRLVPFDPHIKDWDCFDADSGKDLGVELREYFIPDFERWKDHDAFEAGIGLDCTLEVRQRVRVVYSERETTDYEPQTPYLYQRLQAASHPPSSGG